MKTAFVLLALCVAPGAASSVSASSAARAWLQSHKSPTEDQLADLKNSNPAAFALVNSLLNKHAHGEIKLSAEERGPDVFRNMMTPRHLSRKHPEIALPYEAADVQEARVDTSHYNPSAAADKDENMVDKLLGAVAGLAGDKGKKIALLRQRRHKKSAQEDNLLAKDADLFGGEAAPAPQPAKEVEVPQVQEQAAPQEQPAPAAKHENSYLKGIDLSGDMPVATGPKHGHVLHKSQGADLQSFSFDDVAPPVATPAPKKVEAPKPKKENVFLKYLGFVNKAPAPEAPEVRPHAPAAPANKQNTYLAAADLLG